MLPPTAAGLPSRLPSRKGGALPTVYKEHAGASVIPHSPRRCRPTQSWSRTVIRIDIGAARLRWRSGSTAHAAELAPLLKRAAFDHRTMAASRNARLSHLWGLG